MTTPLPLTESAIRRNTTPTSFERGQAYQRQGAVFDLAIRGRRLEAMVGGSRPNPYRVEATFDSVGVTGADCSCPYDGIGWCKHIGATLLACLSAGDAIEERPTLESLLADLTKDQLHAILIKLAEGDTLISDAIEGQVTLLRALDAASQAKSATPAPRRIPVDIKAISKGVKHVFKELEFRSEQGWDEGYTGKELDEIVAPALACVEAGDSETALALLEAITEAVVASWRDLEVEEEGDVLFDNLAGAWVEALLSAELTRQQRDVWASKLRGWATAMGDGSGFMFEMVIDAAESGWDNPTLQRILDAGPASDDSEDYDEDAELTLIRLRILERQGRLDAYVALAAATGQALAHGLMAIRLGRIDEAVAYAMKFLTSPEDALAVATALRENGALVEALRVAEHVLTIPGRLTELAAWTRDLATGMGERGRALAAGRIAFDSAPSVESYGALREIAAADWPLLREELLGRLRTTTEGSYSYGPVAVFLHEGLVADAIALADRGLAYGNLDQVVQAAIPTHAAWAIRVSKEQAEAIMDAAKAQHYQYAARWLRYTRDAYTASGRVDEWRAYLATLMTKHGRKYSLTPLLKGL